MLSGCAAEVGSSVCTEWLLYPVSQEVQEGATALGGETSLLVLRVHGAVYCQYLGDRSVLEQSALSSLT